MPEPSNSSTSNSETENQSLPDSYLKEWAGMPPNSDSGLTTVDADPNSSEWSYATKGLLDSLPRVWTRGLLYLIFSFVAIALPWGMLSEVDETGSARGRLEPKGKIIKLDAPVGGTVAKILVKEGDKVQAGQPLIELESDLVSSELQQLTTKLEGQQNRLNQLEVLKNQILVTLRTQEQQNKTQQLEKQSQVEQARRDFEFKKNAYDLQKLEKQTQVDQARQNLSHSKTANNLATTGLKNAQREYQRYRKIWQQGAIAEIKVIEQKDLVQERRRIKEQTGADVKQAELRFAEQKSNYQKLVTQLASEIQQSQLRLQEFQRSYQSLIHSGEIAVLRIKEQLKDLEGTFTSLSSEISQIKSQIQSKEFQLQQRVIKASEPGTIFDLTVEKAGAVVQPGRTIAELAPNGSSLVLIAQMPTSESGSLRKGMDVKLKFDAYPFQDYGIVEGKLISKSPTSQVTETAQGQIATFDLEVELASTCIQIEKQCEPLKPGDTATAEVIVHRRKMIDFILNPFKKLQKGGLEL